MRKLALAILLSLGAAGQQPQQQPAQPQASASGAKFSTTANLVIVDVTVKDKSGKPIEGLAQRDFTVLEDGKPQKISVFEFQKLTMDLAPPEAPPTIDDLNALPEAPR